MSLTFKVWRIEKGLTQSELVRMLKSSTLKIGKLERENNINIFTIEQLKKLAEILDKSFEEILNAGINDNEEGFKIRERKMNALEGGRKVKYLVYGYSSNSTNGMLNKSTVEWEIGCFHGWKKDKEINSDIESEIYYGLIEKKDGTLVYLNINEFKFIGEVI
ncbi:unknown [Clostridium sp. CAG:221]|uniref:helix-turn-helix transcriptional regulator n=1 Tax=Clostridium sp. CAG:221 TaxID=1262780 RepID=UPI000339AD73|nr:helix-turn-helix transcriptional regulator [Clostridium sp. CAG:221]CDB14624.1 unknown [Clostridium sp. CAG:221]